MSRFLRLAGVGSVSVLAGLLFGGDLPGSHRDATGVAACKRPSAGLRPADGFGQLRGDVDGDRVRDRVFLAADPAGRTECRYLLVLATKERRLSAPIGRQIWFERAGPERARLLLWLDALIALGRPTGLDIVVNVDMGASVSTVEIFTLVAGATGPRLVQRTTSRESLTWGGGVLHYAVLDCAGRFVLRSTAAEADGGWRVSRRVFRALDDGRLRLVRRLATRKLVRRSEEIAVRFPEFAVTGEPFRSCVHVRGGRPR